MHTSSVVTWVLAVVAGSQSFLSAPVAGLCFPGNGFCEKSCLTENVDHGGDCTREDLCAVLADNGACDAVCFDYEQNTSDCICLVTSRLFSPCSLACIASSVSQACECNPVTMQGNNHCDIPCMREEYEWDWGDCYQWS